MAVFVLQLNPPSVSFIPLALQFTVSMFSISISSMPNNACPFPGTTKEAQIFCLLLCSIFSLHLCNCVNIVQLYFFSFIFVFFVTANCSVVALGNNFLNIYNSIMFPSLPVSTLNGTVIMTLMTFLDLLLLQNDWH